MTIHKSKGLEFPVVMMPSMDFTLDNKSEFLLETGDYVVYKKPADKDVLAVLREAKAEEEAQILTDRVNICYVGMTRPKERLYIHNAFETKKNFGAYFHSVLTKMPDISENDGVIEVTLNSGPRPQENIGKGEDQTTFVPTSIHDRLWFPHISLQDNEALGDGDYLSPEMQYGIQFHTLISRIEQKEEIDGELNTGIRSGDISIENKDRLKEKLHAIFDQEAYCSLFENNLAILSEQAFIVNKEKTLRPDRVILKEKKTVILDYKTGIPSAKDEKQVTEYAAILSEMGYPSIEAYLFYTFSNELRRVC